MDYRVFEHTADVGIEAYGHTLEEAFENAAKGMFSIITNGSKIDSKEKRVVQLAVDSDEEQLLVDWLSELLYINDVEGLVFGEFKVSIGNELVGEAWGEKYDREKHGYGTEIKAVTYHMLQIKRNKKGFQIRVLFDI